MPRGAQSGLRHHFRTDPLDPLDPVTNPKPAPSLETLWSEDCKISGPAQELHKLTSVQNNIVLSQNHHTSQHVHVVTIELGFRCVFVCCQRDFGPPSRKLRGGRAVFVMRGNARRMLT
eukprot:9478297-Pyramimonas_sp.AAC.1